MALFRNMYFRTNFDQSNYDSSEYEQNKPYATSTLPRSSEAAQIQQVNTYSTAPSTNYVIKQENLASAARVFLMNKPSASAISYPVSVVPNTQYATVTLPRSSDSGQIQQVNTCSSASNTINMIKQENPASAALPQVVASPRMQFQSASAPAPPKYYYYYLPKASTTQSVAHSSPIVQSPRMLTTAYTSPTSQASPAVVPGQMGHQIIPVGASSTYTVASTATQHPTTYVLKTAGNQMISSPQSSSRGMYPSFK